MGGGEVPISTRHDLRIRTLLRGLVEQFFGCDDSAWVSVLGECVLHKPRGVHAADALTGDFVGAE